MGSTYRPIISGLGISQPAQQLQRCLPEGLHGGNLDPLIWAVSAPAQQPSLYSRTHEMGSESKRVTKASTVSANALFTGRLWDIVQKSSQIDSIRMWKGGLPDGGPVADHIKSWNLITQQPALQPCVNGTNLQNDTTESVSTAPTAVGTETC